MRSLLTAQCWRMGQATPLNGGIIYAVLGSISWEPGVLETDDDFHYIHCLSTPRRALPLQFRVWILGFVLTIGMKVGLVDGLGIGIPSDMLSTWLDRRVV